MYGSGSEAPDYLLQGGKTIYLLRDQLGSVLQAIDVSPNYFVTLFQRLLDRPVGGWDARSEGLGGWTLDAHHVYDAAGYTLLRGDGERATAFSTNTPTKTVAGTGKFCSSNCGAQAPGIATASPISSGRQQCTARALTLKGDLSFALLASRVVALLLHILVRLRIAAGDAALPIRRVRANHQKRLEAHHYSVRRSNARSATSAPRAPRDGGQKSHFATRAVVGGTDCQSER